MEAKVTICSTSMGSCFLSVTLCQRISTKELLPQNLQTKDPLDFIAAWAFKKYRF
jgi:hypothetical protein